MKILITGGTGFISKNLITYLESKNYDVWFQTTKNSENKKAIHLNFTNYKELKKLSKYKFDVIIHSAAYIPVPENKSDKLCALVNFNGTLNLLKWSKKNNIKKFIYLSSISIFNGYYNNIIHSDTLPLSQSDYSNSKYAAEFLCNFYRNEYNLNLTILRLGTVFGNGMNECRMFKFFYNACFKNENLEITDSEFCLNMIYIKDAIKIIEKCISVKNGTFNIAPIQTSKYNLALTIKKLLKSNSKIKQIKGTKKTNTYSYYDLQLILNDEKLFLSLKESIIDYIKDNK